MCLNVEQEFFYLIATLRHIQPQNDILKCGETNISSTTLRHLAPSCAMWRQYVNHNSPH